MRIIYASDAGLPGIAANTVHVMKMSQAFAYNGHKVVLIARKSNQYEAIKLLYEKYSVKNIFDIHMSPYPGIKGKGLIYSLDALLFIKIYKPDIIYGRSLYVCSLSSNILNVPVFFEAHGEINKGTKYGFMFKKMIKSESFQRLVVISEQLSRYFQREWLISKDKILVAHDGADLYENNGDEILDNSIDIEKKNIGYFGSLYKGKGVERIIELAMNMPKYDFHVFGGNEKAIGFWREETRKYSNIVFHGFIDQKQIGGYAQLMDVLIAPYQPDVYTSLDGSSENIGKYMSPLKLFEYMSFERPIVCTDLPVIREILKNGEDSILCDYNDIDQWISWIKRLCKDYEFSKMLSQNAKRKLENKFTWKKRAEKVVSI